MHLLTKSFDRGWLPLLALAILLVSAEALAGGGGGGGHGAGGAQQVSVPALAPLVLGFLPVALAALAWWRRRP